MSFRHLDYAKTTPVEALGAAAIDDLLERGDLESWRAIASAVRADPNGALADTVLRLCDAHPMYGTAPLWRTWIERLRGGRNKPRTVGLAELRARAGATQQDVASKMGIAQSDVSKLERRTDAKLSTLRAYVEALDGELEIAVRLPGRRGRTIIWPSREES